MTIFALITCLVWLRVPTHRHGRLIAGVSGGVTLCSWFLQKTWPVKDSSFLFFFWQLWSAMYFYFYFLFFGSHNLWMAWHFHSILQIANLPSGRVLLVDEVSWIVESKKWSHASPQSLWLMLACNGFSANLWTRWLKKSTVLHRFVDILSYFVAS